MNSSLTVIFTAAFIAFLPVVALPIAAAEDGDMRQQIRDLQRQERQEISQLERDHQNQMMTLRQQHQEKKFQISQRYEVQMEALHDQQREARKVREAEMRADQEQRLGNLYDELGLDNEARKREMAEQRSRYGDH
jgi:uncharacterized membrane protein YgaE (UPF0421/DUF939 family)